MRAEILGRIAEEKFYGQGWGFTDLMKTRTLTTTFDLLLETSDAK